MFNIFNDSSEDFLEDLFSNQPSGNITFSSHPELTSFEVNNDIFDSKGGNVLSEKLLDLDSTKDLHLPLHKSVEIITRVVQDKELATSNASSMLEDFDPPFYEPLFFKEVPSSKMLLPFSSENEEKIFKPGIHTSEKVHSSFISELSHHGYKIFKINQIFKSQMKIFLFSCGKDTHILAVPCLHFYPLDQFMYGGIRNLKTHAKRFCPPVFISSTSIRESWGSPFFWQWEHLPLAVGNYTASGNSLLAVGMPCAFYSQHGVFIKSVDGCQVTQNWMVFIFHVPFWNEKWLVQGGTALVQEKMALGKDKSNLLPVGSLLKTTWSSIHHLLINEVLTSPEQTTTGKDISNPFIAVMVCQKPLGYFSSPMIHVSRAELAFNPPGYCYNSTKGLASPKVSSYLVKAYIIYLCCCEDPMLRFHDLADFGVPDGLLIHAGFWLLLFGWLLLVLFYSCCWNKDAILELTSEDLSRILKLMMSHSRLGEDCWGL
nr:hypothetical protein [Tanacetum cinerariifolium]